MALTQSEKLVHIGRIERAHGIAGEVKVRFFTDNPAAWMKKKQFLSISESGHESMMRVLSARKHKDLVLVLFEGIQDRDQAELLCGLQLYVQRSELAALDEDEYYYTDLKGMRVLFAGSDETVGTVTAVFDNGSNGVLELELEGRKNAVNVPFIEDAVLEVDMQGGFVRINADFAV